MASASSTPAASPASAAVVAELRHRFESLLRPAGAAWGVVSSGFAELDRLLPAGGWQRGTLVEFTADEPGAGATFLALRAAREALRAGLPLVVVDEYGWFHPPAFAAELDLAQLLLVAPRTAEEADWVCDQALRTPGVGAVLRWLNDRGDERRLRRWQLAAEESGTLGLIVRHGLHRPEACFSDVRCRIVPLEETAPRPGAADRLVRVELLRLRHGRAGGNVELTLPL